MKTLLQSLTERPLSTWITTGRVTGTVLEESWPAYDYSDAEIDARITSELNEFTESPPAVWVDDDYRHDHLEAIAYNVRYMHRASSLKEERFSIRQIQDRFHWQTDLVRFQDLVELENMPGIPYYLTLGDERFFNRVAPAEHASRRFNPDWHQRSTVVWNGQEYLVHDYAPAHRINHALRQVTATLPSAMPAPLIAGLIPWGHGIYTRDSLMQAAFYGRESIVDGTPETEIVITHGSGAARVQVTATLIRRQTTLGQPAFALVSCRIIKADQWAFSATLSGHTWLEGKWVPAQVVTERPHSVLGAERVIRETFLMQFHPGPVDTAELQPEWKDTWVSYRAPGLTGSLRYQVSETVDTEALLQEKIGLLQSASRARPALPSQTAYAYQRNCATLSLDYAARALGYSIEQSELAALVDRDGQTSLSAIHQLARRQGFNCQVVQGDINALSLLKDSQVILYLPAEEHFVLLGDVDTFDVWLIDLQQHTFFYPLNKHKFKRQWQDGIALVLSTQQTTTPPALPLETLTPRELETIRGGQGYDCTKLIQNGDLYDIPCPASHPCDGTRLDYSWILGCEPSETGTCTNFTQWALKEANCLTSMSNPGQCTNGRWWVVYYRFACY
jgi:hypothetical protein